jgi:F0F1-type ATP synthase epsilon subunit
VSSLSLEVSTPAGVITREERVSSVVVRRAEGCFDPGSEIVFLPRHGPTMVHTAGCVLRYGLAGGAQRHVEIGPGFAEMFEDHVVVVAPWARPQP